MSNSFWDNNDLNGFKTKNSLKDIRTAQAFLIDLFDYLENKN